VTRISLTSKQAAQADLVAPDHVLLRGLNADVAPERPHRRLPKDLSSEAEDVALQVVFELRRIGDGPHVGGRRVELRQKWVDRREWSNDAVVQKQDPAGLGDRRVAVDRRRPRTEVVAEVGSAQNGQA